MPVKPKHIGIVACSAEGDSTRLLARAAVDAALQS
jgi:hypothetical protein